MSHPLPFMSIWTQRSLLFQLVKREIVGRYKGSWLGMLWAIVHPVIMLAIYTFVFSTVFRARWGAAPSTSIFDYALMLFAGLIVFNLFSESVSRAPSVIFAHSSYVKRVVFPLELLPLVPIGAALFHFLLNLLVLVTLAAAVYGHVPWTTFMIPWIMLPHLLLLAGLSWFLSGLGVYLRDIGQAVPVVLSMLMFLSPVFYPIEGLPDFIHPWLAINPLTTVIEWMRAGVISGSLPNVSQYLFHLGVGLGTSALGLKWFQLTRKGFADVL